MRGAFKHTLCDLRNEFMPYSTLPNVLCPVQTSVVTFSSCDPGRKDHATVYVTVLRNRMSPMFTAETYDVVIDESMTLGEVVVNVTAQDSDVVRAVSFCCKAARC